MESPRVEVTESVADPVHREVEELIHALNMQGVSLWAYPDGELVYTAGVLTAEEKRFIRVHKAVVCEVLEGQYAGGFLASNPTDPMNKEQFT